MAILDLINWTNVKTDMYTDDTNREFYKDIESRVKNGERIIVKDGDKEIVVLIWHDNKLVEMPVGKV